MKKQEAPQKPTCEGLPGTRACEDKVFENKRCCGLSIGECVSIHSQAKEKQEGYPRVSRIVRMTQSIQTVNAQHA